MQDQPEPEAPSDLVTLGVIGGAYGIKGWVKVFSSTDPIENILTYKFWRLKLKHQEIRLRLVAGRKQGKGIIAKLEGYDDRNAAETLRKAEINVLAEELPALAADEYYGVICSGLMSLIWTVCHTARLIT